MIGDREHMLKITKNEEANQANWLLLRSSWALFPILLSLSSSMIEFSEDHNIQDLDLWS